MDDIACKLTSDQEASKVAIVTQARMGSSRLPDKVLLTAGGLTLLDWQFRRLASCGVPIILATSTHENDDPLCRWAEEREVPFFRGSEDNVLSRYVECAKHYQIDTLVRVTSDCPLIDGSLVEDGLKRYFSEQVSRQYLTNGRTYWPRGFDFEIFSGQLLEEAFHCASEPWEFEHVTPYFYLNKKQDIMVRYYDKPVDDSHLRVTVDTYADYELIKILIEDYNAGELSCTGIIDLLNSRPELVAINRHVQQKAVA